MCPGARALSCDARPISPLPLGTRRDRRAPRQGNGQSLRESGRENPSPVISAPGTRSRISRSGMDILHTPPKFGVDVSHPTAAQPLAGSSDGSRSSYRRARVDLDANSDAIVSGAGTVVGGARAAQGRNLGRLASDESGWPHLVPRRSAPVLRRSATSGIGQRRRSSTRHCKRTGRRSSRSSTPKPKRRPFLPSSWRRSRRFCGAGSWHMVSSWRGVATAGGAAQSRFHVAAADSARAVSAGGCPISRRIL